MYITSKILEQFKEWQDELLRHEAEEKAEARVQLLCDCTKMSSNISSVEAIGVMERSTKLQMEEVCSAILLSMNNRLLEDVVLGSNTL